MREVIIKSIITCLSLKKISIKISRINLVFYQRNHSIFTVIDRVNDIVRSKNKIRVVIVKEKTLLLQKAERNKLSINSNKILTLMNLTLGTTSKQMMKINLMIINQYKSQMETYFELSIYKFIFTIILLYIYIYIIIYIYI